MLTAAKNKIILELVKPQEKNSKGLFIPENTTSKEIKGIVVSAGENCKYLKEKVIYFDPTPSKVFIYREKTYFAITEDEVIGYDELPQINSGIINSLA